MPSRADRSLERALIANFVTHLAAIAMMALVLVPFLPGGTDASDVERARRVAEQPWLFRLGWLPWHACAVTDLWLAVAMLRVDWLPRIWSVLVLLLTVPAVLFDQGAQLTWITRGVELAERDVAAYLALERTLMPMTSVWAAVLYTLAGLGWTFAFARAGVWSRALTWLSPPVWSAMTIAVASPLLPPAIRPSSAAVAAANAVGFLLLQVWLALLAEAALRRRRPFEPHGRLARWRHPGSGLLARALDLVANSRLLGAMLEPIPELAMESDIEHVVYVNYLVPAELAQRLVPEGLELDRLGPKKQHALFTFLSFRHGHFGFSRLGPLRKLMPSPVQTNWRVHVRNPETGHAGIYFVTNAIASTVLALAARLTTEGMPMHVIAEAELVREGERVRLRVEPGAGSAPDVEADLRAAAEPPAWSGAWARCFPDFRAFLAYCVPQDRAMSSQPLKRRVSRHEIHLGIPLEQCQPLVGSVRSRAARAMGGDQEPLCFYVPGVRFRFGGEIHDVRRGTSVGNA